MRAASRSTYRANRASMKLMAKGRWTSRAMGSLTEVVRVSTTRVGPRASRAAAIAITTAHRTMASPRSRTAATINRTRRGIPR